MANKNRTKQKQNNKRQNTQNNHPIQSQQTVNSQSQEKPNTASSETNTNETKNNNELFNIVSQATILVLVLTALTYSFTALFKSGYHHYYHIYDSSLLIIDTNDLARFFLVAFKYLLPLTAVYIVIRGIFLAPEFFLRKGGVKSITIVFIITCLFVPAFISWSLNINNIDWRYLLAWACVTNCIVFYQFFSPKFQSILQFLLIPLKPYSVFFILSAFIFLGLGSYRLGVNTAIEQREYTIIPQDNVKLIVISNHGNNLITAPFNEEKQTIKSTFTVIPMKNQVSLKTITLIKPLEVTSEDK
ncbi:hypothetical protein P4T70_24965 [Bacillus mobilis]|uniref:hypothetical protein n=1 Tax=Bacillus mobilis TaxID=2026190 RepID=UPI002E24DC73|nr:hypothetical protein [Bacillus mobilis]